MINRYGFELNSELRLFSIFSFIYLMRKFGRSRDKLVDAAFSCQFSKQTENVFEKMVQLKVGLNAWNRIHNTLFSLYLMSGPNKLECLSLANLSSLLLCRTLAYWAHLYEALRILPLACRSLLTSKLVRFYQNQIQTEQITL